MGDINESVLEKLLRWSQGGLIDIAKNKKTGEFYARAYVPGLAAGDDSTAFVGSSMTSPETALGLLAASIETAFDEKEEEITRSLAAWRERRHGSSSRT